MSRRDRKGEQPFRQIVFVCTNHPDKIVGRFGDGVAAAEHSNAMAERAGLEPMLPDGHGHPAWGDGVVDLTEHRPRLVGDPVQIVPDEALDPLDPSVPPVRPRVRMECPTCGRTAVWKWDRLADAFAALRKSPDTPTTVTYRI